MYLSKTVPDIARFDADPGSPFQLRISYDPSDLRFTVSFNGEEVGSGKYFLPTDVEFDALTADGDVTILYMGFPLLGEQPLV